MWIAVFWIGFLGVTAVAVIAGRRRKLAPLAPIGDAPDAALVRIAGTVATENRLRAPLSGRPCTCYWVCVRTLGRRRMSRSYKQAHEFELVDATGKASVPAECILEVSADHFENTTPLQLTERLRSLIAQVGVKLDKVSAIEICEGIVAHGDEIEVVGAGMRRAIPGDHRERGFRDLPASLLELRGAVLVLGARRPIHIAH